MIVSHEILATASRQQVRRALESFGDAEVHVVLSARDLVRQIPAEWQENVKHRRTLGYRAFLDTITDPAARRRAGVVVLGRAGGPRRPRPVGRHAARRSGCTWSPCPSRGRPATCSGTGSSSVLGLRRLGLDAGHHPREPVPRACRRRRCCGGSTHASTTACWSATTTASSSASCSPTDPVAARSGSPRLGLPDDVRRGRSSCRRAWIDLARPAGGTTSSAPSTSCAPTRPTRPRRSATRTTPTRRDVADAAVQSIVTLLGEASRLQRVRAAAAGASSRRRTRSSSGSRGLWFRVKRRLVLRRRRPPARGGRAGGLPQRAGRSSRSA